MKLETGVQFTQQQKIVCAGGGAMTGAGAALVAEGLNLGSPIAITIGGMVAGCGLGTVMASGVIEEIECDGNTLTLKIAPGRF